MKCSLCVCIVLLKKVITKNAYINILPTVYIGDTFGSEYLFPFLKSSSQAYFVKACLCANRAVVDPNDRYQAKLLGHLEHTCKALMKCIEMHRNEEKLREMKRNPK